MKRDPKKLIETVFDVLVIGGGIYGAALARAAALQNFRVALIEQFDFGSGTSANSLKIIHGGLRYLQHFDIFRMRESISARRRLLKIAPHLVRPLPCLVPTYGFGLRSQPVMALALALNDVISYDRNRGLSRDSRIPRGKTISQRECSQVLPNTIVAGSNGGAVWHDAIVTNSERLNLEFVMSAVDLGACALNYMRASSYLLDKDRVIGVSACDSLTNKQFNIKAKWTINAGGAWDYSLLNSISWRPEKPRVWAKAINVLTKRTFFNSYAVGLPSSKRQTDRDAVLNKGTRDFFFVPWRGGTMIGTTYKRYDGAVQDCCVEKADIESIVNEVNQIVPEIKLKVSDICFSHVGLLPAYEENQNSPAEVQLKKKDIIIDLKKVNNTHGLILVSGIKYTTAHEVADKVLRIITATTGQKSFFNNQEPPLLGGNISLLEMNDIHFQKKIRLVTKLLPASKKETIVSHLKNQYGKLFYKILSYIEEDVIFAELVSEQPPIIAAEVIHGVREEMANTLMDVLVRRTELGSFGHPGTSTLEKCAGLLAKELGWDDQRITHEINVAENFYKLRGQF
jgi:glycerol-3-phosphate dehydrogenase